MTQTTEFTEAQAARLAAIEAAEAAKVCQGLSQCVNALGRHDRRCPAAEPPHELREALVRWLAQRYSDGSALEMRGIRDDTDALLAGPLAPLLGRLTRAEAAVQRVQALGPDAVLVEGDWVSPSREAHARDLLKAWADAAANAGCPPHFVERMRTHVEVHERARAAAAALSPESVQS